MITLVRVLAAVMVLAGCTRPLSQPADGAVAMEADAMVIGGKADRTEETDAAKDVNTTRFVDAIGPDVGADANPDVGADASSDVGADIRSDVGADACADTCHKDTVRCQSKTVQYCAMSANGCYVWTFDYPVPCCFAEPDCTKISGATASCQPVPIYAPPTANRCVYCNDGGCS